MMDKVNFVWSKTNRWHKGLLLFLVVELRLVPSGQIGFTCNDPALSYPFTGDTISWKLLLITTVLLPLAVLLIVERKYHNDKSVKPKQQALCWYKEYLFGVLLNLVIVQSLKLVVGSPRPHFFDTCAPKEASTCEGCYLRRLSLRSEIPKVDSAEPRGYVKKSSRRRNIYTFNKTVEVEFLYNEKNRVSGISEYVSRYTCTKAHWLSQSDRSFPSGHTSLAVHTGLFLAYYLYRRTRSPTTKAILTIQLACIATAILCSVSRITDHRHHWWDVLAGAVIAAPVLFYTTHSLCGNFHCTQQNPVLTEDESKNCDVYLDTAPLVDTKVT